MRLKDKIAIILGAGQSPGEGLGNGRATVLRFAQEGAKVLAVDKISPPLRRRPQWQLWHALVAAQLTG
jgi:NAD(P)-dependent dehydrogenase (short-subunit alcohol dehydrogenase family)